jgi:hypothetical protein
MSISAGRGMPKLPVYVCHPCDSDPVVARHFGASLRKTHAFDPASDDPRQQVTVGWEEAGHTVEEHLARWT